MTEKKSRPKQLLGTVFTTGSAPIAEIIALSGFDWVMIDMEHAPLSLSDTQVALQVFGDKMLKMVRVPGNDGIWIKRVLDLGCDGIIVPMVNSAEEAERVVKSARYPIEGQRSVGLARAHKYGPGFSEYVMNANKDVIIMVQIEHFQGVANIDSIIKVKGLNAIFIGPYDLSASMGLVGQVNHPEVQASINLVKKKCREAGLPYAIYGSDPEALAKEMKDGCSYLACGVDISILSEGMCRVRGELDKIRSII